MRISSNQGDPVSDPETGGPPDSKPGVTQKAYRRSVGGREYLGCVGVLAVLSLMSGVGVAAVAGTVLSLFIGPIVLVVIGAVAFAVWAVKGGGSDDQT